MSHSSARSGMIEPLPALAAVLVVGLSLGLYADAIATVEPDRSESGSSEATLQSVYDAVSEDGAALPRRIPNASGVAPAGYEVNVTLAAGPHRWTAGPVPPERAAEARRRTPVRIDRWTVQPGRLGVVVWT